MTDTDASLLARLQEIQARADKATEGPWTAQRYDGYTSEPQEYLVRYPSGDDVSVLMQPDADFIAHAREDIPYLLTALRRSGEALRRLEMEVEKLPRYHCYRQMERDSWEYRQARSDDAPNCDDLIHREDVFELVRARAAFEIPTEEAARSASPQHSDWKPIETAPKDGTKIDLWCRSADGVEQWRETNAVWNNKRGQWANRSGFWDCATHWRLPYAPPFSVRPDAGLKDGHLAGSPDNLATIESLQSDLATLRSTHATLQSALDRYGLHEFGCGKLMGPGGTHLSTFTGTCSCGLDLALNGAPGTE